MTSHHNDIEGRATEARLCRSLLSGYFHISSRMVSYGMHAVMWYIRILVFENRVRFGSLFEKWLKYITLEIYFGFKGETSPSHYMEPIYCFPTVPLRCTVLIIPFSSSSYCLSFHFPISSYFSYHSIVISFYYSYQFILLFIPFHFHFIALVHPLDDMGIFIGSSFGWHGVIYWFILILRMTWSYYWFFHPLIDMELMVYSSLVDMVLFLMHPFLLLWMWFLWGVSRLFSWRDLTSYHLMLIMLCESSHTIYSLTRWLYFYIILRSAFLRISGQLAFGVQLVVYGFVWRRSKASRRLMMRLIIFLLH